MYIASSWKSVHYSRRNVLKPSERWGHSLARVSQGQVVVFGGYGGSSLRGQYLSDLWTYDIIKSLWKLETTTGDLPEARSNYSLHFNSESETLILYGGGTQENQKFNDIHFLDWKTKKWKKVENSEKTPSPMERTYHCSSFKYPYLIVFGGQSLINFDLNDIWIFDVRSLKWRQLQFLKDSLCPCPRRFSDSVIIGNYFYLFGGCTDIEYKLLGDAWKVDLSQLFNRGEYQNFMWENILSDCKKLRKWGHSCDVYQDKVIITCGMISPSMDTQQILVFDPKQKKIDVLVGNTNNFLPRRKHASVIVGSTLLVFGGFNGKYLNNFDYLSLSSINQEQTIFKVQIYQDHKQLLKNLSLHEDQSGADSNSLITLRCLGKQKFEAKIQLDQNIFLSYQFFKSLFHNSSKKQIDLLLPSFCDELSLKIIVAAITKKGIYLPQQNCLAVCEKIIKIAEYFCLQSVKKFIQNVMIQRLNQQNCHTLYKMSSQLQLHYLKLKSIGLYLINNTVNQYDALEVELSRKMIFQCSQLKLKNKKAGLTSKIIAQMKKTIKPILSENQTKIVYFVKFLNYLF